MAQAPPILIYQPGGGVSSPIGSNPPVYSQAGTTVLIAGQQYVDVVFGSVQTDDEWIMVECVVVNEIDADPLNIRLGIVTDKTEAGFRLYLNGLPDSGNYYLHWSVSGINIQPFLATTYLLSGPSSGEPEEAATFIVSLPPSAYVNTPLVVTPSEGGLEIGVFSPETVTLTTDSPSATFTFTPATYGETTITVNNDGALTDPDDLVFNSQTSTYELSGPSSGDTGSPSTDFTVELPPGGVVVGTVTVTPGSSGGGGAFTPATVALTTAAPSDTFTYTASTDGTKTISVNNDGGLTDPANLSYVASTPLPTYTLTGPSSGDSGTASTNFTVTLAVSPAVIGTVTVTPSDGGDGGTFTPTTVGVTTASPVQTFTYTPASTGVKTISSTNDRGITNPVSLSYTSLTPSPHLLTTLTAYWKMDEASGTRADSTASALNLTANSSPSGVSGKINNGCQCTTGAYLNLANSAFQVTTSFAYSLWINISIQGLQIVLGKWDGSLGPDYGIIYSNTTGFEFFVTAGTTTQAARVGSTVSNGVWTHLVAWFNSVTGQVYLRVNDTTTYSSTTCPGLSQSAAVFGIGANGAGTFPCSAVLDEVGFWKRTLSATEITALYNGGSGLAYSSFTS